MKIPFFFVGSCIGSLLNVICYRIQRGEDFVSGRSRCDHCGKTLSFMDMVPIVSWLLFRGKCRYCGKRIPAGYPITELVTGIISVLLLDKGGYEAVLCWIQAMILVLIALFDMETMEFPSVLTYLLMLSGVMMSFVNNVSIMARVIGAVSISIPMMFICKRGLVGDGNVLIFAITGWTYGYMFLFRAVIISSVAGLIYSLATKKQRIPFCPFLAFGIIVSML